MLPLKHTLYENLIAIWEPYQNHMGNVQHTMSCLCQAVSHGEIPSVSTWPQPGSSKEPQRLGFAGSFSTVLLRCLTGNWSFLMALTVVPWGNQTWFAGKCTIYQWFSWLETSIQVGDFALPCLITRGYLC